MTQNQIAYFNAVEQKRHNQAVEAEAQRSAQAKEYLERRSQNITSGHYARSDSETARANRAQERLKETAIGVDYARLAETQRSNLANEAIGRYNAQSQRIKANSGAYLDYSTAGLRHSETALKDLEASYTIARTNLTDAQTATERAAYYNEIAQVGLTQAQRERVTMETQMMPINTWSNAVGNVGKLVGGVSHVGYGRPSMNSNSVDTGTPLGGSYYAQRTTESEEWF